MHFVFPISGDGSPEKPGFGFSSGMSPITRDAGDYVRPGDSPIRSRRPGISVTQTVRSGNALKSMGAPEKGRHKASTPASFSERAAIRLYSAGIAKPA